MGAVASLTESGLQTFTRLSLLLCGGAQVSINEEQPESCLDVSWKKGEHHARLMADLQTRKFSVYATQEGKDGEMHCNEYNLQDTDTKWALTSLSEEQIKTIGLTKTSSKKMQHFSEV